MRELVKIVEGFSAPRVALMGDFMLDRWVYGSAERLSQEAPVPVLKLDASRRKTASGGAGNAAEAISALGAKVACMGVIGADADGEQLKRLLTEAGADAVGLIPLSARPTTVKTRYVGLAQHRHVQQMFRVDSEADGPIDRKVATMLAAAVRGELRQCKVLALEDYNKGVLSEAHTPELIAEARKAGCIVIVDPALISSYRRYRGATLLTPNRYEAALATGIEITDDESLEQAAKKILAVTQAEAVMITLDREGAYLLTADGPGKRIPTRPRTVYDVSGAGDEVLAMLAVAISEGCCYDDAVALANVAGGLEVQHFGVEPLTREDIVDELRHMVGLRCDKTISRNMLSKELTRRRKSGEVIAFTNGCFDLLHVGHVRYLQQARRLGSCLVVGINSDESVKRLKGPDRPVIGQAERAEMLGALECVDYVAIFDEDTPEALLEVIRPDVLAKGGTTDVVVGREIVEGYGGKVLTLEKVEGFSTTQIIDRITGADAEPVEHAHGE